MRLHVLPLNDEREHEETDYCWCFPALRENDSLVVHNSADCRETSEVATGEGMGPEKRWLVIEEVAA